MQFIIGASTSGRANVGFVYANEFLNPFWQVVYGTYFNFMIGFFVLVMILYFEFINKHYVWIYGIGWVFVCISALGAMFVVPESPLWQLKMGRVKEA